MRGTIKDVERRVKLAVAAAGIALMAGAAGWGGSLLALSGANTPAAGAPNSTAEARPTGSPATSMRTATSATTTPATTSAPAAPSRAAVSASAGDGRPSAVQSPGSPSPAVASSLTTGKPDIMFVRPSSDGFAGHWYYVVGLIGFPPETVVEISGQDPYGNPQIAPLVMTTADGSSNPFAGAYQVRFGYGGTCAHARPATVTARGKGFSVSETAPPPRECDGGTTPNGSWKPPTYAAPTPTTAAPTTWAPAGS
jgi:hypothetical protein